MAKVVHVSDRIHAAAVDYCGRHDFVLSGWVGELIAAGVAQQRVIPQRLPFKAVPIAEELHDAAELHAESMGLPLDYWVEQVVLQGVIREWRPQKEQEACTAQ